MVQEKRIQAALEAIRTESVPTIRKAADLFEVPRSALQDRLKEHQSHKIAHAAHQRLSAVEEDTIARIILRMSLRGYLVTIKAIETFATQLLQAKGDTQPLDHHWYQNFLARHPDLKVQRSRELDQARNDASITELNGTTIDISVTADISQQISSTVAQVLAVCPSRQPEMAFLKETCLTALADKVSLQIINEELVKKLEGDGKKKTRKRYGRARVLTVEEM